MSPAVSSLLLCAVSAALGFELRSTASAPLPRAGAACERGRPPSAVVSSSPAPVARTNPRTGRFDVKGVHHVELWCSDASSAAGRFAHALGMDLLAKSDATTGNVDSVSQVIGSGECRFVFTAPVGSFVGSDPAEAPASAAAAAEVAAAQAAAATAAADQHRRRHSFVERHGGLAVRAVCIEVADAAAAYDACLSGGGESVLPPAPLLVEEAGETRSASGCVAEVKLYGDAVLRLLTLPEAHAGAHLPGYVDVPAAAGAPSSFGIARVDHCVGNVWEMLPTIARLKAMTGFHEFAEFTAEEVGTLDSGLNSMVLASDEENVLLPVNEPTYGTPRRSQIYNYLIANGGEGVQHIALATEDIFETVARMREVGARGGFTFMEPPSNAYYDELPARIGDALPSESLRRARDLGILIDRDDQGVLLQLFTRPVGDAPTLFLEIIQRAGCELPDTREGAPRGATVQKPGCGGFGKGNFKELFKSVEKFEQALGLD